jgi:ATP-dependent exoDNAse (exonuclease V) beta subunit
MQFVHLEQPKLPTLVREQLEDGKRWYRTPEGNKYASITTILGHEEKPWLNEWRESMGLDKADVETKRCAERGTNIHSLIEKYLNNVPNHTAGFKQEYINGFNQIKPHLNKISNIRAQEVGLYSDTLEVAGTVDCVGDYEGVPTIIDFKTSNRYKDTTMIEDYFLQVTAYALMWYERTNEPINDIVILMTVEKGIVPLVFKDKMYKYVDKLDKRIVEYIKGTK